MKDVILTNSEKIFVTETISKTRRVDGRQLDESRKLRIHFGKDYGCCHVSLGETKILAQVSCEVAQPGATRPNEGLLYVNVELSPMGSPYFEIGRQSELSVVINRTLEKNIKDSRCLDLEGLCITSAERVWCIRIDINVLNHEGNLVGAASIAALAALSHFRRPDVTTTGDEIIIHDPSERDPVPLGLHHYPVCIAYAIFNSGKNIIADPTALEERVSDGELIFGVNAYRELCALHLGATVNPQVILTCANRAATQAGIFVAEIKAALAHDEEARANGKEVGFVECMRENTFMAPEHERWSVALTSQGLRKNKKLTKAPSKVIQVEEEMEFENNFSTQSDLYSTQTLVSSYPDESDASDDSKSDVEVVAEVTAEERRKAMEQIVLSDASEEEETFTLQSLEVDPISNSSKKSRDGK